MTDNSNPAPARTPAKAQRVLVLQGGGALGSYQAGAYQALCHHDFEPEWIAGISIGAVNAAIIAGNPPEKRVERLKEFGRWFPRRCRGRRSPPAMAAVPCSTKPAPP
jgi:NTE family protein